MPGCQEVRLFGASSPVSAREFYGSLPDEVRIVGSAPRRGQAIAGSLAGGQLGLMQPVGGVASDTLHAPVVGGFYARHPLDFLERSVLVAAEADVPVPDLARPGILPAEPRLLRSLYVMVTDVDDVDAVTAVIRDVIESETSEYSVATPAELVELRSVVADELGASSRQLMLLILGVGLVTIAVLASLLAALAPGCLAAYRDPVRIPRVP